MCFKPKQTMSSARGKVFERLDKPGEYDSHTLSTVLTWVFNIIVLTLLVLTFVFAILAWKGTAKISSCAGGASASAAGGSAACPLTAVDLPPVCRQAVANAQLFFDAQKAGDNALVAQLTDLNITVTEFCSALPGAGTWHGFDPSNPRSMFGLLTAGATYWLSSQVNSHSIVGIDCDTLTVTAVFHETSVYRCAPGGQTSQPTPLGKSSLMRFTPAGKLVQWSVWADCSPATLFFTNTCNMTFPNVAIQTDNDPSTMEDFIELGFIGV